MKRFKFTLQSLLDMRERHELECQRDLAKIERQRLEIEDRLRAMQARIDSGKSELTQRLTGQVDADSLRQQATMTMHLDAEARRLSGHLAEVYREGARRRQILAKAQQERKSIERLRERRFEQWKREQAKREELAIDDLVSTRFAHELINGASGDAS